MSSLKIVVVGMDVRLAAADDLDAFARGLYAGNVYFDAGDSGDSVALASVIEGALDDAGIPLEAEVAVLTVGGGEGAPASLPEALASARQWLAGGDADAVVVAAGGAGSAGAVALQTPAQAAAAPRRYAVLEALEVTAEARSTPEAVAALHRRAWLQTDLPLVSLGYLELAGDADPRRESASLEGVRRAYRTTTGALTCGLGALAPGGTATPMAQMAGFIKTVLCLHQRFIPVQPNWRGPEAPERWEGTPFYVDAASRPWFVPTGERRVAAFYVPASPRGSGGVVILTDTPSPRRDSRDLQHAACLLPLVAQSQAALLARLAKVREALTDARTEAELHAVARRCHETYRETRAARYTLCLVGEDRDALLRDIAFAFEGVARAFETQQPWQTPGGSYFTPRPLAREGTVAFVYPGAFNAYPNLGRDLFRLFPQLHDRFEDAASDLGDVMGERFLYPRSLAPLSRAEQRAAEEALLAQPVTLIEAGTIFAMLFTSILRDDFGVRPAAALGYSLGEASMLWANGVWQDAEASSRLWRHSPLFRTRLAGPKEAIREAWGIAPTVEDDAFWRTYLLKAPVDAVRAQAAQEPRVELIMINTPDESLIGGDPAGCQRVIQALGCHALLAPYDAVIHAGAMRLEQPALVELYTHAVRQRPPVVFYSAAGYAPLTLESPALAHALAGMTCRPVDFPRLVRRAYADGARLFVEVGPQRTCTRWIERILAGQPHAAVAMDKKGAAAALQVFGVLAQLLSHGVAIEMGQLYAPEAPALASQELPVAVPVGAIEAAQAERTGPSSPPTAPFRPAVALESFDLVYHNYEGATRHCQRLVEAHSAFLQARQTALQETGALIQWQIDAYRQWLNGARHRESRAAGAGRQALFDEAALQAFAAGSPERCFGSVYAAFAGRRLPCIPNGDLLLMSRIVEVTGKPGALQPGASLVGEYDVPADAWFYRQNAAPVMPYAVLMEIALQPCGFLSAYLESALSRPESDFYFRNLDGAGRLLWEPDLRGHTVTNRVCLLSSTTLGGVILQRFTFTLACEEKTFYEGEASFGYFEAAALQTQAGLDSGQATLPWYKAHAEATAEGLELRDPAVRQRYYVAPSERPYYRLAEGQLDLLERVCLVADGGQHGRGYVYAEATVDPGAWFFKSHFYQDPVMPGSLGVQAIQQALQAYAIHEGLGAGLAHPTFTQIPDHRVSWKYRGQIQPEDGALALEAHVREVRERPGEVILVGDASLWKADRRIYEVNGTGIGIREQV